VLGAFVKNELEQSGIIWNEMVSCAAYEGDFLVGLDVDGEGAFDFATPSLNGE
jgi:hypothetical protein